MSQCGADIYTLSLYLLPSLPTCQTDNHTATKAQHIRLTAIQRQSPTCQTDSHMATKAQHIRLTAAHAAKHTCIRLTHSHTATSLTNQTDSDKSKHIRQTVTRPRSPTHQTDNSAVHSHIWQRYKLMEGCSSHDFFKVQVPITSRG